MSIQIYFLLFIIYSSLGWLMEVICKLVEKRNFVNRGFLIGPYCPIYGFGFLIMSFFLTRYLDQPVLFFFMALLICTIFEYLTSFIMEKVFHARWWDYSQKKFNINGRVYLNNMIAFGALAVVIFYFLNPFLVNLLEKMPQISVNILSITLLIVIVTDCVLSFLVIRNFSSTIKGSTYDNTEEITKYVRETFMNKSYLSKRLIKAYPNFQTRIKIKLKEIKEDIKEVTDDIKENFNLNE